MRRILALVVVVANFCHAEDSNEKLAATARLWNYVKYFHPRVTSTEIDWDRAFTETAPKVLQAKSNEDFSKAIAEMLAVLQDPNTRLASFPDQSDSYLPVLAVKVADAGVTLVRLEAGDMTQGMASRNSLLRNLTGATSVVFDLRGSKLGSNLLPPSLPLRNVSFGPRFVTRRHSGYAPADGSGGYHSTWEMQDALTLQASPNPIQPVFLVNSKTLIPPVAFAIQSSGAGAIVSEDPISDEQVELSSSVAVLGNLRVMVRTREMVYPDGTTGVAANVVLNKTGEEALKEAMEIARTATWQPPTRTKRVLPPANFAEKNYADQAYPSAEYRMLAAARIWGVFHYFHPYNHLYGEDWDSVLAQFLTKMRNTENAQAYHLAVAEMVAHTHDTHCFVSSRELSAFYGAPPAIEVRWIEDRPVVTRVLDTSLADKILLGDVVTMIDGSPVKNRIDELTAHISASTPQSMMSRVMQMLLNGPNGSVTRLGISGVEGTQREVEVSRASANAAKIRPFRTGEVFRLVTPQIGYVDLERITNSQVDAMFDKFRDTTAIIMDMRGYPQGTAWSIAPRLSAKPAPIAAQFRRNIVSPNNVAGNTVTSMLFEQRIPTTNKPHYSGKTIMLIDERAISQSEHSGLFYKTANGTVFVGSPTTGANGDVTYFHAPGGIRINFSGHDVRWPDGKQLQRIGLLPDVEVSPTIEGVRSGRDEVLLRAIAFLEKGGLEASK